MTTTTAGSYAPGDLAELVPSWDLSLRALNRSVRTRQQYLESARQLIAYLRAAGMPTEAAKVRREHVEAFLADVADHWKPATVQTRYKGLRLYFSFLEEEGEVPVSPITRMKPPSLPEVRVPVLSDDQLRALLKSCEGKGFDNVRDTAIVRLFIDTGLRRAELSNMKVTDLDLPAGIGYVMGKGRRERVVPFGAKTATALDRYLRKRRSHSSASSEWLWLGGKGRLT